MMFFLFDSENYRLNYGIFSGTFTCSEKGFFSNLFHSTVGRKNRQYVYFLLYPYGKVGAEMIQANEDKTLDRPPFNIRVPLTSTMPILNEMMAPHNCIWGPLRNIQHVWTKRDPYIRSKRISQSISLSMR